MARKIFISCQHLDCSKAKGFNLLRWNKNVDFEFVGRHLLDPVDSEDHDYITSKIKEQLDGSSVTVVLLGRETAQSEWVADEIRWSLEKGNALLGIRLETPGETPQPLIDCGAEIIDWNPDDFQEAIERALRAFRCGQVIVSSQSGSTCAR